MMRSKLAFLPAMAVLAGAIVISSCGGPHYYRGYDPYYGDYHVWGPDERAYYQRWETETHRDHREFRQRPANEQKEYYTWRHGQPDHHDEHK